MTAKKSARKKTSPKKASSTKKAGSKKTTAKKKPAKKATAKKPATAASSLGVNMGHVFALRPRVSTTFRQGDLATAKHQLQDESYASISDAARAVAERALELTHDAGSRLGTKYGRP